MFVVYLWLGMFENRVWNELLRARLIIIATRRSLYNRWVNTKLENWNLCVKLQKFVQCAPLIQGVNMKGSFTTFFLSPSTLMRKGCKRVTMQITKMYYQKRDKINTHRTNEELIIQVRLFSEQSVVRSAQDKNEHHRNLVYVKDTKRLQKR